MINKDNAINPEELEGVAGGRITGDQAYDIALKHAGKKKNNVKLKKSEFDYDDGIAKYEIKFVSGFTEYEYDIDANTGNVLKFEKDLFD